eukprot:m.120955 g.120955  ORF g.120955 m.120955 type:complete len:56 (+) comp13696_c0_seq5:914-1081(+)
MLRPLTRTMAHMLLCTHKHDGTHGHTALHAVASVSSYASYEFHFPCFALSFRFLF